jgi:hypothetical protein
MPAIPLWSVLFVRDRIKNVEVIMAVGHETETGAGCSVLTDGLERLKHSGQCAQAPPGQDPGSVPRVALVLIHWVVAMRCWC